MLVSAYELFANCSNTGTNKILDSNSSDKTKRVLIFNHNQERKGKQIQTEVRFNEETGRRKGPLTPSYSYHLQKEKELRIQSIHRTNLLVD
jgi:hypothetical protein